MNLEDHANCYYLEKEIMLLTVGKKGDDNKALTQKRMNTMESSAKSAKW